MERSGAGRRIPAALLDGVFLLIIVLATIAIYAAVGGTKLASQAQEALGVDVSLSTVASEELWNSYERRAEETIAEFERTYSDAFTEEQARRLGTAVESAMKDYFLPEQLSVRYFLELDEEKLDEMIETAFDAAIEASDDEIDEATLTQLRSDVDRVMDDFGLGTIIPAAISFAIWLALLPLIVTLFYGLIEGLSGRSLGKMITGIGVRKPDGERAYAGNLLLRYAIKHAPLILIGIAILARAYSLLAAGVIAVGVVLVGALAMLGPERRAAHDYLAGTAVYRVRQDSW
jgi:uncharacterized RDD family membrane protein YckC